MVVASLLPYLRDRSPAIVPAAVFVTLLVVMGLLAFAALLAAATAGSSAVDAQLVGPFRWEPLGAEHA